MAGNYDSTTATDYKHCGCRYEDPQLGGHTHKPWYRVERDLERAMRAIRESTLPDEFGEYLRTGGAA